MVIRGREGFALSPYLVVLGVVAILIGALVLLPSSPSPDGIWTPGTDEDNLEGALSVSVGVGYSNGDMRPWRVAKVNWAAEEISRGSLLDDLRDSLGLEAVSNSSIRLTVTLSPTDGEWSSEQVMFLDPEDFMLDANLSGEKVTIVPLEEDWLVSSFENLVIEALLEKQQSDGTWAKVGGMTCFVEGS